MDILSKMMAMDSKKKDKLITVIVVAVVACMMIGMAVTVYMYGAGSLDETTFMMASSIFSGGMFIVIMVYGALALRGQNSRRYEQFEEEYKKRQQ